MHPGAATNHIQLAIPTSVGTFTAHYSAKGLAGLNFPSARKQTSKAANGKTSAQVRRWHRTTAAAVKRTLAGRAAGALPPLDLTGGTEFQRQVWNAMKKNRVGRTQSYGEIARAIGNPNAVRAVGGACGANPIPVLIPCHRVLATNKQIGGFSAGLHWKRKLLEREEVELN